MPSDFESRGTAIIRRADKMFTSDERTNAVSLWELCTEFFMPNQMRNFISPNQSVPGQKTTSRIFESTPIQANLDLAASLHDVLTNPAVKWSTIRYKNEELNNDKEAVQWLEDVNKTIHDQLNESTFDTNIAKSYKLFTALGNMALFHEDYGIDEKGEFKGFKFTSLHLSELAWSENSDDKVDTLYRKFKLSARQAIERWGDKVSDAIKDAMEIDPEKKFSFVHCISPRDKKEVQDGIVPPTKRPFSSMYVETKERHIVEEGGYYEFPVHVVRWETMPGEVYGRGCGHIALPETRTLNNTRKLALQALALAAHPPIFSNQRNFSGSPEIKAGQITVIRDVNQVREFNTNARFDVTQLEMADMRNTIKQCFFLDKLMLPDRRETGEMTAFEIQQRTIQMQRVLGSTLGRLNAELLQPLILRSFNILLRAGALPPLPASVGTEPLNIEIVFVNQLARSQRMQEVTSIQAWVNDLAAIAQLIPEALDYVDIDGIAKHTAKVRGVPEIAVESTKEVEAKRQQRNQQMQAQQALEAGVQAADIKSKLDSQ